MRSPARSSVSPTRTLLAWKVTTDSSLRWIERRRRTRIHMDATNAAVARTAIRMARTRAFVSLLSRVSATTCARAREDLSATASGTSSFIGSASPGATMNAIEPSIITVYPNGLALTVTSCFPGRARRSAMRSVARDTRSAGATSRRGTRKVMTGRLNTTRLAPSPEVCLAAAPLSCATASGAST